MPQTALKEMINYLEDDNYVGAAVAIEDYHDNPFITSVLEAKAPDKSAHVLEIVEQLHESAPYHDMENETAQKAYAAFINVFGEISIDSFECAYQGEFRDDEEFATYLVDDAGIMEVPEHIAPYVDYEKFARDIMHDHTEEDGHYFSNHW